MTGGIPVDVVQFVGRRFATRDSAQVLELLDDPVFSSARLMRAVLYLAGGSMSLLKHYASECKDRVDDVLLHAEKVVGVAEEPMPARDMSLPFSHEDNLGPHWMSHESLHGPEQHEPTERRSVSDDDLNYHGYLARRRFVLGNTAYLVALTQPNREVVRCYRREGNVSRLVNLPLVFVLERLAAEHIDISENRPSDFISSVR
tara:strand:- start:5485 stop:6090 length:606 start_codon:yes stop_codon:yes gene_type:complete